MTFVTRGLWGTTAAAQGSGRVVNLVEFAVIPGGGATIPDDVLLSNSARMQHGTSSLLNNINTGNTQLSTSFNIVASTFAMGAYNNMGLTNGGPGMAIVGNASSGNQIGGWDTDGIEARADGTLAVTGSTATIAPVKPVTVLTGTVPTSGTLTTMTVESAGACTTANMACTIRIINTTGGSLVTGSGASAGNFAAAFTLPVGNAMDCTAYGTTALWYCN
jgi:hypothetical protein